MREVNILENPPRPPHAVTRRRPTCRPIDKPHMRCRRLPARARAPASRRRARSAAAGSQPGEPASAARSPQRRRRRRCRAGAPATPRPQPPPGHRREAAHRWSWQTSRVHLRRPASKQPALAGLFTLIRCLPLCPCRLVHAGGCSAGHRGKERTQCATRNAHAHAKRIMRRLPSLGPGQAALLATLAAGPAGAPGRSPSAVAGSSGGNAATTSATAARHAGPARTATPPAQRPGAACRPAADPAPVARPAGQGAPGRPPCRAAHPGPPARPPAGRCRRRGPGQGAGLDCPARLARAARPAPACAPAPGPQPTLHLRRVQGCFLGTGKVAGAVAAGRQVRRDCFCAGLAAHAGLQNTQQRQMW